MISTALLASSAPFGLEGVPLHRRHYAVATITLPLAEYHRLIRLGAPVHPTKKITLYPGGLRQVEAQ